MIRHIVKSAIALGVVALAVPAFADESDKAPQGSALFTKYKCNTCHSIEAAKIERTKPVSATMKRKPPDLSKVGDTRGHEWIEKFLVKEEKIEGTRSHPYISFKGTKDEREALAAWLETMKTPGDASKAAKEEAKEAKEEAKDQAKEVKEEAKEHEHDHGDSTHAH